jgi:hypothetical protein
MSYKEIIKYSLFSEKSNKVVGISNILDTNLEKTPEHRLAHNIRALVEKKRTLDYHNFMKKNSYSSNPVTVELPQTPTSRPATTTPNAPEKKRKTEIEAGTEKFNKAMLGTLYTFLEDNKAPYDFIQKNLHPFYVELAQKEKTKERLKIKMEEKIEYRRKKVRRGLVYNNNAINESLLTINTGDSEKIRASSEDSLEKTRLISEAQRETTDESLPSNFIAKPKSSPLTIELISVIEDIYTI